MKRVFAHIGFAFAITMLVLNLISADYFIILVIGLAVLLIASLIIKKYRKALAVPICLGAAIFACLIFSITMNMYVEPTENLNNAIADCEFYITELPQKKDNGEYSYVIKTTKINYPNSPQNIKVRLKTKYPIKADCYQIIKGRLVFHTIAKSAFSSYGYWGKNIFLSSKPINYTATKTVVNSPMRYIINARKGIKSRLSTIGGDEGALSQALIIGDKSEISPELYTNFRISGAAHLMAVSGLHLTAISGFVLFILKKLRLPDKAIFIITIGVIAYYCALCGFSKSVVRAGIMMSVLMLGNLFGRHSDPLNSLGLAVFIIALNPFAVCDAGAVLSVLCVLSLCTAYPYLERKISVAKIIRNYRLNRAAQYILKALASAFCIIAYSICAYYIFFGYISLVSLVSGVLLIPLGSFATVFTIVTDFFIRLKIGAPFVFIIKITNRAIIFLVGKFASLRFAIINFENYFGLVAAGILIILAICFIINKKHIKTALIASLAFAVISVFSMSLINNSNTYVYVTESGALAICDNQSTAVFGVNSKSDYYSIRKFVSTRNNSIEFIGTNSQNGYSSLLADEFNCKKIVYRTYSKKLSDSIFIDYKTNREAFDFTAKANDITISNSSNSSNKCNINISNKILRDKNGYIDLSNGDIIYRISNNNYRVRRVNIWQE